MTSVADTASKDPAYSDDPESPYGVSVRAGSGNWEAFIRSGFTINDVLRATEDWKLALAGVERPWLCWNVDSDWSLVQQRLVESVGWTPVVGFDPRVGAPQLSSKAVLVNFNQRLGFKMMKPHFVLDYVFAFAPRLAFWHSDLLIRPEKMKRYADQFAALSDGDMIAVDQDVGFRRYWKPKELRYWELLGCTTAGASRSNFDTGCGWWLAFYLHPNCPTIPERKQRFPYHWEYGVGIRYWRNRYNKTVGAIPEDEVAEGHFTRINNAKYKAVSHSDWRRNLSKDLSANFDLKQSCEKLGLLQMLA